MNSLTLMNNKTRVCVVCVCVHWCVNFCKCVGCSLILILSFFLLFSLLNFQEPWLDFFLLYSDFTEPPLISSCQIYIANTAGHITSPTSKAASWKAQRNISRDLQPSSLRFSNMLIWSLFRSPSPSPILCFMCEVGQNFNDTFTKLSHLHR